MKKFTFLFIVLCGFIANQSFAQFTGKVQFNSYDVKAGHKQKDSDDSATLYITPQRIFVQSSDNVELGGSMDAKGLLIRNDKDDILIFKGSNKAMKLSKASIISFMNMAAGFSQKGNDDSSESEISIKKTGKTKMIDGYKTEQFMVHEKDEKNQHSMVWMTKDLDINWGFLTDIAKQAKKSFGETGQAITNVLLKEGYFPVLGKEYENNKLDKVFKIKITPTDKAKNHVSVPSDIQIMSLQQFMMQKMQQMQKDNSN